LFKVTIDTGDAHYGHAVSWTAKLKDAECTALIAELKTLQTAGTIEGFRITPLSFVSGLEGLRPEMRKWIKANPHGRAYGGPEAR
jgi:hypothetical protein